MTDIPFRGYITGVGIEGLLPNVPFLEYERNIFNVLLVLTFPGKSPEELIEKCEDFWDLLGEDPGRLLILLRLFSVIKKFLLSNADYTTDRAKQRKINSNCFVR